MATRIPQYHYMVYQKAVGNISPRLQLMLNHRFGPEWLVAHQERESIEAEQIRQRVHLERVAAAARGVQVVVDETRPDHYVLVELPDE